MSGEIALWAARQNIENLTAKMVLIAIGDAFDDRTGLCFPSHAALCDFVRRSQPRIREAIRWLEDEGWIKRESRFTEKGRQTSNSYEIIFERGETFSAMIARRRKIRGGNEGGGGKQTPARKRSGEVLENDHPKGAENDHPRTESLLNKGAQARDLKNDTVEGVDWRNRLVQYRKRAIWPPKWGPRMGEPGCLIPPHLVAEWIETQGAAFAEAKPKRAEKRDWTKTTSEMRQAGEAAPQYNRPGTSHD